LTISYPQQVKLKRQRAVPPPIAPTAALRADAAMLDALRLSGGAVAQAFQGALWAVLLSNLLSKESRLELGQWGTIGVLVCLFTIMAAFIWASMQGQGFGRPRYSSGLSPKFVGAAKYTLIAGFVVLAVGLLTPVGMFLAWERNVQLAGLTSLMQLCIVVWQLLFSAALSLRAVQAIRYARQQLSDLSKTDGQ
jgi:hypothetical protein